MRNRALYPTRQNRHAAHRLPRGKQTRGDCEELTVEASRITKTANGIVLPRGATAVRDSRFHCCRESLARVLWYCVPPQGRLSALRLHQRLTPLPG